MIQNNLQINPGNRVDFSRLRKYKPGGNIHKFQNPNQPIQMTQAQLDTRKRDWPFPVSDGWITNGQYDYAKMYKYLSKSLGHSSISITLDLYSHLTEESDMELMNDFGEYMAQIIQYRNQISNKINYITGKPKTG